MPFNVNTSDKELLENLKTVWKKLKRLPSKDEMKKPLSQFSVGPYQKRFGSWYKALQLFAEKQGIPDSQLPPKHVVSKEELLENLRTVREKLGRQPRTHEMKKPLSLFSVGSYYKQFGSWNKALQLIAKKQSIPLSQLPPKINIAVEELLENLKTVWETLGRQPRYKEMKKPLSLHSRDAYRKRFGSWNKALKRFIAWVNSDNDDSMLETESVTKNISDRAVTPVAETPTATSVSHKTKRNISERMRFHILMRDGFACRACGKSPATQLGVELHVDHIIPWSKGGETTADNLQTLCKQCNLGKGNAFEV